MLMILSVLICAGCGNSNSQETEKIVIGLDESPLGYRNATGEFVGFEVSLAKETAKRMGVKAEFKLIDWDKKEEELNSRRIDIIWNGLNITPARKQIILFSKPYMDSRQVITVKNGNPQGIYHVEDLEGKIVGAKAGTSSAIYIEENENLKNSFKEFKLYNTDEETFKALENDEIDALVADEIVGRFVINKQRGKFEIVETKIGFAREMGIGFRKDDTVLRDRVQKAFDEVIKDGTAKRISEEWFQADLIKSK